MIIVEYISDEYKHSDVNAATITIFMKKYSQEKVHLFCGETYFNVIKKILENNNINYENIIHHPIKPFAKQVRDFKMILFDFNIVNNIFKWAKQHKEKNLLFLYTSTFMLYYTKFFCILNKSINVKSIVHGDLERADIIAYAKSFKSNKLWQFLYALFFGLRIPLSLPTPKNLKYIVLGENIRQNAEILLSNLKNRIEVIPYPYFYIPVKEHIPFKDNKLHLCVSGLSSVRKNIPILRKLLNFLEKEYSQTSIFELSFGGIIMDKTFYETMLAKDYVKKETLSLSMLSNETRDRALNEADYTLVTYPIDSYKFIANGSFMDTVNMEKPVLATKNDYIAQYFNKYGNIGYLFNSYEELEAKVKDIMLKFPIEDYQEQVRNIRRIKERESIDETIKNI